ncbi:MAG: lptD [Hydrocarboniphaga sp.]|uniref:LPS-assembly protein LptD n=1 Tax=Hydrocarboniphaga sp. TaxID=2033016 RepID=UPI0026189A34|nr:LPS assembly protein LptD [Hydrocarboniphaga sp.]MDB5972412.1 lptD [Hydrocarboniphaga sp.]
MTLSHSALLAACTLPALLYSGLAAAAVEGGACSQPTFTAAPAVSPPKPDDKESQTLQLDEKVFVDADSATMTRDGLSQLMGSVKVRQGDKEFVGENLDYDDSQRLITVDTESVFSNPNLIIKSQTSSFNLNDSSGVFNKADFVLPVRGARGTSDQINVATSGQAQLKHTVYTTCAPGSNAWYLEASDIKLDQDEGLGTARNARLRFGGVPVLYMPWFQFPINDQRRTGLLFPTVGDTSKTGFDARWPVYLNLADNYDATITPRLMTKRGLQIGTSGRYLLENGEGSASYDYLDDDKTYGASRSLARFDHANLFTPDLGLEATYAKASDSQYFEDLGGTFASSSITYLERSARLTYQSPASFRLTTLVQTFQTIDTGLAAVDDPYKRLPQIHFDALTRNAFLDTRAGLNAEYVNFVRDEQIVDGQRVESIQGQRFDLQPYLRYQRDLNAWYLTSQFDWHYTGYKLSDTGASLIENQPSTPSRSLPIVSAETGLRFDRITGSGAIQTLEPRLFALYVPYQNQDRLPLFDTGEPDFDFTQLFARNRFFGEDRISDAENLTAAVTTRMIDPDSGDTRWSASFGQLYRFEASRVALPGQDAPDSGATDFIGEVSYNFLKNWSAAATGQWSPDKTELERRNVALRYRNSPTGSRFDIAYRDHRGLLEQTDVSFDLPVSDTWRIGARNRYSLRDSKTLETFMGASYETCCWAISAAYRRYIASSDGELNSGVYFQLELKGLSRIGTGFASLLPSDNGDDESSPGALGSGSSLSNGSSGGGRHP